MTELASVVDAFVVVEAAMTFSGGPHTPLFNMSAPSVAPFADRTFAALVTELPVSGGNWAREEIVRCEWLPARR